MKLKKGINMSTLLFSVYALGQSYWVLFAARAIQGVSSSCTAIAGKNISEWRHRSVMASQITDNVMFVHQFFQATKRCNILLV